MVPRSVLMKTSLKSLNTVRPVNTAHSKTIVYSARPMSYFSKSAQSTVKSPYQIRTSLTNKFFSQKVNTAKGKSYTARPKAVDTVRPNSAVVNIVRANQVNDVKALACWVWRPTKLNSASITLKRHNYVDARGRSKHMTGNMSYLLDFKKFDGGYVTFGGGAKGGKIIGKRTFKTGKLDFEDATAKAKTINGEVQIQALVDGKKVIITKTSVRRDFQLKDVECTECLPNATIFTELERMGAKTTAWNEFSSTMASAIICLATNQKINFPKYIFDNMVKNLEGGVKFLMYPRFVQVFLDKQVEGMTKHKEIYGTPSHTNMKREGKGSEMPTVTQHTSTINQPSSSQPPKKQKHRKTKKQNTEVSQPSDPTQPMADKTQNVESVPIHSNDLLLSEITKLKERVKKLERRNKSRTPRLKRLRKVGRSAQVVSSNDKGLGAQEDASKQGRKIANLNADAEEVEVEKVVSTAEVTTVSATLTTVDELTLAQTLIEVKAAKPKAVTTAATTAVTRLKARGIIIQEPSEFRTTTSSSQTSQLPQVNDKGKAKMIEPENPLKKKDQILVDEEIAQRLQQELQAKLEEEEKLTRQKEEDDNLISWDNTQAMMEADYELAQR
ncbi:hypothetical protein Tco_0931191, partial [Tanacetum coccineum]